MSKDQTKMSTVTREEFEARIEAVEARMDARVAGAIARMDATDVRIDERFQWLTTVLAEQDKRANERLNQFDKRLEERDKRLDERDKRLDERDKRIELIAQGATAAAQRAAAAAENASNLRTHMWLAASTVIVAVMGTVIGAYYATQSSHLAMAQTLISAFQHGQQMQTLLKP